MQCSAWRGAVYLALSITLPLVERAIVSRCHTFACLCMEFGQQCLPMYSVNSSSCTRPAARLSQMRRKEKKGPVDFWAIFGSIWEDFDRFLRRFWEMFGMNVESFLERLGVDFRRSYSFPAQPLQVFNYMSIWVRQSSASLV